MELNFTRDHVLQTAPTQPNTLVVFPQGKNKQQKVIVGDTEGSVQCFCFKPSRSGGSNSKHGSANALNTRVRSSELSSVFKHLPTGYPIQHITVALPIVSLSSSANAVAQQKDKAFLAVGNSVYGLNKRGKEFFRFKTNVTESISTIKVHDVHLYSLSKYTYSHYVNCEDKHYFLANDLINDMTLMTISNPSDTSVVTKSRSNQNNNKGKDKIISIIGCQDGYIRAISDSDLYYEAALQGAVSVVKNDSLCYNNNSNGQSNTSVTSGATEILYGLDNGTVGQMLLGKDSIRRGWIIDNLDENSESARNTPSHKSKGSVRSIMGKLDVTHDGVNDVVVGRDDGTLKVYGFNYNGEPELLYNRNIGETIHTLDGGFITSGESEEIIAQTYSGKVLCFHPSGSDSDVDSLIAPALNTRSGSSISKMEEARFEQLSAEVKSLEKAVRKEQKRYSRISTSFLKPVSTFHVKDKFCLNVNDGSYTLQLETTVAVIMLSIQSNLDLHFEDVTSSEYSGVVQYSKSIGANNNINYLMTYRCHQPTKKIELKMWPNEGKEGNIQVFILPLEENTAGSICNYKIVPLSLHKRIHNTTQQQDRPMSTLLLGGQFIMPEAHSWVSFCLPELPSTFNTEGDQIKYVFQCCRVDTYLECYIQAGRTIFRSDSVTTLLTLKNCIVSEATAQHIRLEVKFDIHPNTLRHLCELVWPKLSYQRSLERKMLLIDGILEIQRQETNLNFLTKELHEVISDADNIRREHSKQPKVLERIKRVIFDTYVGWHKLKGQNVHASLPRIEAAFDEVSSLAELVKLLSN